LSILACGIWPAIHAFCPSSLADGFDLLTFPLDITKGYEIFYHA